MMTPYEKLKSLPKVQRCLKSDFHFEILDEKVMKMLVQNDLKKNVINYLTRSLNKINEPKNLLISDSFVN
jgi:hypothetical protein